MVTFSRWVVHDGLYPTKSLDHTSVQPGLRFTLYYHAFWSEGATTAVHFSVCFCLIASRLWSTVIYFPFILAKTSNLLDPKAHFVAMGLLKGTFVSLKPSRYRSPSLHVLLGPKEPRLVLNSKRYRIKRVSRKLMQERYETTSQNRSAGISNVLLLVVHRRLSWNYVSSASHEPML